MEEITFAKFSVTDIPVLTDVMKRAFDCDSMIHLGRPGGPEGYDTGEFLRKWGLSEGVTAYTIHLGERMIGSAFLWINHETKENFLGNIYVDPDYQNMGMGTRVWAMVEALYPETRIWRTETASFSVRNHYFYVNKCGFHIVHIDNPKNSTETNYHMEKIMTKNGG